MTKDFTARQADMRAKMAAGSTGALSADSLKNYFEATPWMEHQDMGNLTPRILRCINGLNSQMGAVGANAALRRVHHNAESHRYRLFDALTGRDMVTKKDGESYGDGFPLTCFQPSPLDRAPEMSRYGSVCTIEDLLEFKEYAQALQKAGFYVPKNWVWAA